MDRKALIRIVEASSFLFSVAISDGFLSICIVQEISWALTLAFKDFTEFHGRKWQLMAASFWICGQSGCLR
jgi:hypothetical protein